MGKIKKKSGTDSDEEGVVQLPRVFKSKRAKFKFAQSEKAKKRLEKKERRQRRDDEGLEKQVPFTLESKRHVDATTVGDLNAEGNEEVEKDVEIDEMSSYFNKETEPKVLVTFCDNPTTRTRSFGRELTRVIPNSIAKLRSRTTVKKMVDDAIKKNFTDIIIINEDQRKPNGLLLIHLPEGPTAHFRVSNVKITSELKRTYKEITHHRPEVVLNNFGTRLGLTVSRMLASIFHYDPEFKGRRAVTFHNQRDFIFFRHHRYEFKNAKRVAIRELGPRFTLRLRSLQVGTFDSKYGDYEWIIEGRRHEIEHRRRFWL